jgi:hypothetical protein
MYGMVALSNLKSKTEVQRTAAVVGILKSLVAKFLVYGDISIWS